MPNSFSYSLAVKPHAAYGDDRHVEELTKDRRVGGQLHDGFCHASLLYTYINAKPKQRARAEATFHE